MLKDRVLKGLEKIVGPERLRTDPADLVSYSYDAYLKEGLPGAVVFPLSTEEISRVMKLADEEAFPVTPRGAGTNISGGSIPREDGIVLCLTQMDRIVEIDKRNRLAVAEPGVVNAQFQRAVEAEGLFYPPDPASMAVSTLGGNVAENAGGPRGVKYGVTKDYLLGLEAVLPGGKVMRTGGRTVKNVTGYNLTQLLCGSEGTIGVISQITVRLLPKPEAKKTLQAIYPKLEDAGETVAKIIGAGIIPVTLELMDQVIIQVVDDFLHVGLPRGADALLLIEVDGTAQQVERQAEEIAEFCRRYGASDIKVAQNEEEANRLWTARRSAFGALARLRPNCIIEDATVPVANLPAAIRKVVDIARKYRVTIGVLAHAGDGNLHPGILCDARDKEEMERVEKATREIFLAALELGGTLSGEHGIGLAKADFMPLAVDEPSLALMQAIKYAFDPKGILNPQSFLPRARGF